MFIPAARFYAGLGLVTIIAWVLAQLTSSGVGILTAISLDLLLGAIAWGDGRRIYNKRVEANRLPLHPLAIGRDNPITILLEGADKKTLIRIKDGYPPEWIVKPTEFQVILEPGEKRELVYSVYPQRRGEYQWQPLQLRQLSPWGLVWQDWQVGIEIKTLVYPDLIALRDLSIRLALEKTGTMRQARILGRGTEFTELREYRQGDDTRLIDWKATARQSKPVLRVLEPEQEQTVIILLDRGRLMTAQVEGLSRFDWGLNATLALALAALNRGDRVGVGVFDREVVTWIPPLRGQQHLPTLIERLSSIQPVLLEADYVGVVSQLINQQTRRALVVLITELIDTTASVELISALGRLTSRYFTLCVSLKDPLLDQLADSSPAEISEAYTKAVALDLLRERRLALAILQQKGVRILDTSATQISEELINRYLQIKNFNLL